MRRNRWWLLGVVAALACAGSALADDWPQWRGPQRDGVWRETGIVERFAAPQLEPRWRAAVAGGYSGPTVSGDRVLVTDLVLEPEPRERVHCFSFANGKALWRYEYPCAYDGISYTAGPRAAVTCDDGRAFALGAMGHLHCLSLADGKLLWSRDCNRQYKIRMPIWGIAAAPLVEGDLLIVHIGGEGASLVAFDKRTGEERWRALDDQASYSAPIVIQQAGKRVLVCWTGDAVVGLGPQSGERYWRHAFPPRNMVLAVATPVVHRDYLFVTGFYDGSLMLRLAQDRPAVSQLWRRVGESERNTDALHSIISTPYLAGDHVYGVDSYGEFRCLDARTGDRLWESLAPTPKARWSNVHMVRHGQNIWMFNERGELIISTLAPEGYTEISRTKIIEPTRLQLNQRGGVCWSHPAFAHRHVIARNDEEVVCVSLAAEE